jgi:hypothetical protein
MSIALAMMAACGGDESPGDGSLPEADAGSDAEGGEGDTAPVEPTPDGGDVPDGTPPPGDAGPGTDTEPSRPDAESPDTVTDEDAGPGGSDADTGAGPGTPFTGVIQGAWYDAEGGGLRVLVDGTDTVYVAINGRAAVEPEVRGIMRATVAIDDEILLSEGALTLLDAEDAELGTWTTRIEGGTLVTCRAGPVREDLAVLGLPGGSVMATWSRDATTGEPSGAVAEIIALVDPEAIAEDRSVPATMLWVTETFTPCVSRLCPEEGTTATSRLRAPVTLTTLHDVFIPWPEPESDDALVLTLGFDEGVGSEVRWVEATAVTLRTPEYGVEGSWIQTDGGLVGVRPVPARGRSAQTGTSRLQDLALVVVSDQWSQGGPPPDHLRMGRFLTPAVPFFGERTEAPVVLQSAPRMRRRGTLAEGER